MSKIDGSNNDACVLICCDRSFAAVFIFLMLFAFGKTFYIRFMLDIFYHYHHAFMITPVDTVLNQAGCFQAFPVGAFGQYHVPAVP
jgi:hypothetical protein